MVSWIMQIKISMKATGKKVKDLVMAPINTPMVTLTWDNGDVTQKMVMVYFKWQLVTNMKVIGLMVRKMVKVKFFCYER